MKDHWGSHHTLEVPPGLFFSWFLRNSLSPLSQPPFVCPFLLFFTPPIQNKKLSFFHCWGAHRRVRRKRLRNRAAQIERDARCKMCVSVCCDAQHDTHSSCSRTLITPFFRLPSSHLPPFRVQYPTTPLETKLPVEPLNNILCARPSSSQNKTTKKERRRERRRMSEREVN